MLSPPTKILKHHADVSRRALEKILSQGGSGIHQDLYKNLQHPPGHFYTVVGAAQRLINGVQTRDCVDKFSISVC